MSWIATTHEEDLVQLTVRIPCILHRTIKLHCIQREESLQQFVREALQERLPAVQR